MVYSAVTTVGIAFGSVGAMGFAGWQMVGFGTTTSLDVLIGVRRSSSRLKVILTLISQWWIAGTLHVEMVSRIMIILKQHNQSEDREDNEMLALLVLTDIGLYTLAGVLIGRESRPLVLDESSTKVP